MTQELLVTNVQQRVSVSSSNTKGSDNIITNGSGIAVADGQCMMIVEQGKVVEFCAEPGEFTYDASTEPSIFSGSLGDSIKKTFQTIGKRFTYRPRFRSVSSIRREALISMSQSAARAYIPIR